MNNSTRPLITVLTPAYNRAKLLPRLYQSLCAQTCPDFEWIVVDDGSTDETFKMFSAGEGFMPSLKKCSTDENTWLGHFNRFLSPDNGGSTRGVGTRPSPALVYIRKENGGKHTAVNRGVQEARGELTLILDSDDELPPKAVETIKVAWRQCRGRLKTLGGLCGYMAHRNGEVIGKPMISVCCDELSLRYYYHVAGDMCEVFRTEVLREFPFPEIKGERFCPEALVWNRIAQKYRLYIYPYIIYLRDYLDGGLTDNIVRIRMCSPCASMMTYADLTTYHVPLMVKVKAAINYWRFWYCRREDTIVPSIARRWWWLKPLGWGIHRRDKGKLKKSVVIN